MMNKQSNLHGYPKWLLLLLVGCILLGLSAYQTVPAQTNPPGGPDTPEEIQAWREMRENLRLGLLPPISNASLSNGLDLSIQSPDVIDTIAEASTTVFQVYVDGNYEIYIGDGGGQNRVRLTNDPGYDGLPRLNSDVTQIAFVSDRDGDYEIYRMNLDGSGLFKVTNNIALDSRPDWSPDSSKIAFTSNINNQRYEIYTINTDGTGLTRLTNTTNRHNYDPAWSPDGTQIAYAVVNPSINPITDPLTNREWVNLMNSNGTNQHTIITNSLGAPAPWSYVENLVWASDGSILTFDFVPWDRYFTDIGAF